MGQEAGRPGAEIDAGAIGRIKISQVVPHHHIILEIPLIKAVVAIAKTPYLSCAGLVIHGQFGGQVAETIGRPVSGIAGGIAARSAFSFGAAFIYVVIERKVQSEFVRLEHMA